jgi:hypothetical protein
VFNLPELQRLPLDIDFGIGDVAHCARGDHNHFTLAIEVREDNSYQVTVDSRTYQLDECESERIKNAQVLHLVNFSNSFCFAFLSRFRILDLLYCVMGRLRSTNLDAVSNWRFARAMCANKHATCDFVWRHCTCSLS